MIDALTKIQNQYLDSLKVHNSKSKKSSKGKKTGLLDLDNEDGEDDDEIDEGMAEKEKKALKKHSEAVGSDRVSLKKAERATA